MSIKSDEQLVTKVADLVAAATGVGNIGSHIPLLEGGFLDSVSVVNLVLELESTFEITVPENDITPENFLTINQIARLCQSLRADPEHTKS